MVYTQLQCCYILSCPWFLSLLSLAWVEYFVPWPSSPEVSWGKIMFCLVPPLCSFMLWPLGYSEEGEIYLTDVLVSTSCLVKLPNVNEWQFTKVQGHWALLNCLRSSAEQLSLCFKPSPEGVIIRNQHARTSLPSRAALMFIDCLLLLMEGRSSVQIKAIPRVCFKGSSYVVFSIYLWF